MPSLTLRDIPTGLLEEIRALSERERRSLNKEFLVIIEDGIRTHLTALDDGTQSHISPATQVTLWRDVVGRWEDARSTAEIVDDIRNHRTVGREVHL